jgi:hypothetical protein
VSDAMRKIVQEETWRGLYRGGTTYIINLLGVYSISMTLYELYIDEMMKRFGLEYFKENETMHVIEASIFSSALTVLIMNCMEVIVVRRQSGSTQTIQNMFKEEGYRMFTKGLTAKMIHAVTGGTMFYLSLNKIGKFFDCNISEEIE